MQNAIPGGTTRRPLHSHDPKPTIQGGAARHAVTDRNVVEPTYRTPSVEPARTPPAVEPTYRYEYKDPYAPMSTAKQVALGCTISLVLIIFAVVAFLMGQA